MALSGFSRIADLYDTFVQVDFDVPFFLKEAGRVSGEVLELMAGTGRVSLPLIESGVRLTCVDKSAEMLGVLQQKLDRRGLTAHLVPMDVCDLNLGRRFDLIVIPFHSFSEIVSPLDQHKALVRIREHLAPQGRFICTLRHRASVRPPNGELRLIGKYPLPDGRGTLLFWMVNNADPADDHVADILEIFEEYDTVGVLKSKRLMDIKARQVSRAEFQELAEATGFKTVALYGDYAYGEFHEESSPFMIWMMESQS